MKNLILISLFLSVAFESISQEDPNRKQLGKGLFFYTNYELGLKHAFESEKPVIIFFNGYACVNARKMETLILDSPEIIKYISSNFIFINLYADDRTRLKDSEIRYSTILDRELKIVAHVNWEIQIKDFNSDHQPLWVRLNSKGNEMSRIEYTDEPKLFKSFLGM